MMVMMMARMRLADRRRLGGYYLLSRWLGSGCGRHRAFCQLTTYGFKRPACGWDARKEIHWWYLVVSFSLGAELNQKLCSSLVHGAGQSNSGTLTRPLSFRVRSAVHRKRSGYGRRSGGVRYEEHQKRCDLHVGGTGRYGGHVIHPCATEEMREASTVFGRSSMTLSSADPMIGDERV